MPLAALTAAALLFGGAAEAGAATVTGGDMDWGIKTSFRNYVLNNPAANGSITPSEGATTNDDGSFDYQPGSGSYTPGGAVDATFGGQVFFTGHEGILKFTLADPRVSFNGDSGVLYADVVSSAPFGPNAGQETSYPNVDFATLDLTGITPVDDGSTLSASGIPATLTENGAETFVGFYPPGTALDPISFQFSYGPGELTAGKKKVKVGKRGGDIELAEVECESTSCKVEAPKKISAKIKGGKAKGEKVKLKVKASKERGGDVDVVANLKRGDAKLLASGGSLTLKAKITLKGDGKPLTKTVSVKVVSR